LLNFNFVEQLQEIRIDSIELRNKANRVDMLEKLVASIESTIGKGK
jgi:prefoldin subunit 5